MWISGHFTLSLLHQKCWFHSSTEARASNMCTKHSLRTAKGRAPTLSAWVQLRFNDHSMSSWATQLLWQQSAHKPSGPCLAAFALFKAPPFSLHWLRVPNVTNTTFSNIASPKGHLCCALAQTNPEGQYQFGEDQSHTLNARGSKRNWTTNPILHPHEAQYKLRQSVWTYGF